MKLNQNNNQTKYKTKNFIISLSAKSQQSIINLSKDILEYCNKESLINKEQYYMDILKPQYNICKTAGSTLGFKHSLNTLLKLKNRIPINAHKTSIIDIENNIITEYNSVRAAAKDLGISHTTLLRYINNTKIVNNTYIVNRFN